ncbi:MAG TPA: NUDIX domain-containing protein [Verrucomicrobiae bacterium]|nr:NUDIX domain-containing protein [Verrucomicrobiae bacterium]
MSHHRHEITRCPRCGGTPLEWPTPKNLSCPACGFTLYLNIAAAVAVIIECSGKILFGVRKHDPGRGMLDLPGGFVDPDESAEEAALREAKEELGVELAELRYLFSLPNRYPYRDIVYHTLDLVFLAPCTDPMQITAGDDLAEVVWVAREQVDFDAVAFDSLKQALRRYLAENPPQEER